MNGFETIIYQKKEGIAIVSLNRPHVLNAYNLKMRDELYQVLEAIRDDPDIEVAIFKGEGKSFCAGADLTEFLTAPSPIIAREVRWERDVWGLFLSLPQPLIAALHGYVLGSGVEIALCCDIRIASEDARFGLPETGLGIIPAAGATQNLPRTIKLGWALQILLSGDFFPAEEAYKIGLINKIVPREKLLQVSEEIALKIKSRPSHLVRKIKELIRRGLDVSLEQGLELEWRSWSI